MFDIGRVCVKIAGRDAGKSCVVVDVMDEQYVLVDGQTRRRKCNISHLEPTEKLLKVKKNASNKEVCSVLKKEGIDCKEKSSSKKEKKTAPKKTRAKKPEPVAKKSKKPDLAKEVTKSVKKVLSKGEEQRTKK